MPKNLQRSVKLTTHKRCIKVEPVLGFFGRSPLGRAIRYIFFAFTRQKRMPLLSLTQHLRIIFVKYPFSRSLCLYFSSSLFCSCVLVTLYLCSQNSGCSLVRLKCWSGGPEIGGSNPLIPTSRYLTSMKLGFLFGIESSSLE